MNHEDQGQRWRWAFFQPTQVLPEVLHALGDAVITAGQNIEKGSRKLRSVVPDVGNLIPLAKQVKRAGEGLLQTPGRVGVVVGNMGEHLSELGQEGKKVLERVADLDLPGALRGARDLVGKGVGTLVDYGSSIGGVVVEKVDFNKQIDQLRIGDRYTISVGGDVQKEPDRFLGARGAIDGCIEIWCQEHGYVVSVDGHLAAQIQPVVGVHKGVSAKAELEAQVGAGVRLEMTFETKEQAKRATRSLLQMSLLAGASVMTGGSVLGAMSLPVGSLLSPSESDIQAMRDKISAVELRGHLAAQLGTHAGLGIPAVDLAGLFGEVDTGTELAMRVEISPQQRPVLRFRHAVVVGGGTNVRAGIRMSQSGSPMIDPDFSVASNSLGPGGIDLSVGLGGALHGRIALEMGLQLPETSSAQEWLAAPIQTLRSAVAQALEKLPGRVSIMLRTGSLVLSKKSGLEMSAQINGDVLHLVQSGAVTKLLQRQIREALALAGQELHIAASIRPYTLSGHSLHPHVSVAGFGMGVQGGVAGVDYQPPLWTYNGSVTELTSEAIQEWEQMLDRLQQAAHSLTSGQQDGDNDHV